MKKLFLVGMSVFVLAACGAEEPATKESSGDTTEQVETSKAESSAAASDEATEKGKRSNPVPFGETVQFTVDIYDSADSLKSEEGTLEVSISNLINGDEAYEFLLSENEFNNPAPEGYQWIVFDVNATLTEGSEDNAYTPLPFVTTVSVSGAETPDAGVYATLNNQFGYTEMYDGGTTTGKLGILAPANEDYLIKWEEGFDKSIFFDHE